MNLGLRHGKRHRFTGRRFLKQIVPKTVRLFGSGWILMISILIRGSL